MDAQGRIFKYGDNVDTDVIIPARYLTAFDPKELAEHCMEDIDLDFAKKVKPGDIIVAGSNFGCGSSREHAPLAIKGSGVACVVAASFARIFYRNSVNIGLPILECPEAAAEARAGDVLAVDFGTGEVKNLTNGKAYTAAPFPPFMKKIMEVGGLIAYSKEKLAAQAGAGKANPVASGASGAGGRS